MTKATKKPVLLSGGNPQIPKGDGGKPGQRPIQFRIMHIM